MAKLHVQIVLEILGRPPENVTKVLEEHITKLGSEKGIKIIDKKLHEPKKVKEGKDLYTSFAEVTLELDSITHYFGVLFGYMPAHIELIDPSQIELSNHEIDDLANQIVQRLHHYDALAKRMLVERQYLFTKLQEIAPEVVPKLMKKEPLKSAQEKPKKKNSAKKKTKKAKKKK